MNGSTEMRDWNAKLETIRMWLRDLAEGRRDEDFILDDLDHMDRLIVHVSENAKAEAMEHSLTLDRIIERMKR